MTKMTLNQAILDPKRPLSVTPKEWMMSVEASLAEEEELTKKTAQRMIQAKKSEDKPIKRDLMVQGIQTIDLGLDQIVQGIKLVYSGFDDTTNADLTPKYRKAINQIKDLMDTAIVPYMKDIVQLSDELEDDNKE